MSRKEKFKFGNFMSRGPVSRKFIGGGELPQNPPPKPREVQQPPDSFRFWEMPPVTPVREVPPSKVPDQVLLEFIDVLYNHLDKSDSANENYLEAIIGLDFGTSSTKVVMRFPLEPGSPAIAIPAPVHCRSSEHPYLWQTVLWVQEDGEFLPWAENGGVALHTLKQVLMDKTQNLEGLEAAAAYLSYVIRYAKGWLRTHRPNITKKRRLVWTTNIGIPVAVLDDKKLCEVYRRIAAAAHVLGDTRYDITRKSCRIALSSPKVAVASTDPDRSQLRVNVVPEAAAEATGYINSSNAAEGNYLMVDVGALTLDACVFGFRDGRFHFFTADVKPLGVEAFHWFTKIGRPIDEFRMQCNRCLWRVVWGAKLKFLQGANCWDKGRDLPTFLLGGGAGNPEHMRIVQSLTPWLVKNTSNLGIRFISLPIPSGFDLPYPLQDFGRLAVAWGLSFPAEDLAFELPSQIEKVPELPVATMNDFVSKDEI